jgi:endonuclease III-like uncharacterized protein
MEEEAGPELAKLGSNDHRELLSTCYAITFYTELRKRMKTLIKTLCVQVKNILLKMMLEC